MVRLPTAGLAVCPRPQASPPVEAAECAGCVLRQACPRVYTHGLRTTVSLALVRVRMQVRQHFEDIEELAELIRADGLQQALVVRPFQGSLEVVDGVRRYLALVLIGAVTCDVTIVHRSDVEAVASAAKLNLSGRRLHWLEEAAIVAYLRCEGWKIAQIKEELKRSESWIYQRGQFWSAYRQIQPRDVIFREANTWGPLAQYMASEAEPPGDPGQEPVQQAPAPRELPGTTAMRTILSTEHDPEARRELIQRASTEGLRETDIRAIAGVTGSNAPEQARAPEPRQQGLALVAALEKGSGRKGWPPELAAYLRLAQEGTIPVRRTDVLRVLYALLHYTDVRAFLNDHGIPFHEQNRSPNLYVAALHTVAGLDSESLIDEALAEALTALNGHDAAAI